MKSTIFKNTGANLAASLQITLATILLCGGLYPLAIWSFARVAVPELASGSLVRDRDGKVVGSRLVAQAFKRPEYFWPRPSAVNYDASASGGSNLSPAGPEVRDRAEKTVAAFGADETRPLPADLAAASGSGLDPDITLEATLWQAPRVAQARAMPLAAVEAEIRRNASQNSPFWSGEGLVNVLALNHGTRCGAEHHYPMMYFDFLGAMLSAFSVIPSPTQSAEESGKSSQHTVIYSLMAISRKLDSSLRSE